MSIELNKAEIDVIIPSIQRYVEEEFDLDIGDMKARFLMEYFLKEIGPFAYNKGVKDAEEYFRDKVEDLPGTCYETGLTYWVKKKR